MNDFVIAALIFALSGVFVGSAAGVLSEAEGLKAETKRRFDVAKAGGRLFAALATFIGAVAALPGKGTWWLAIVAVVAFTGATLAVGRITPRRTSE
ncbi:hypothetical protein M3148_16075 [Georgenia satyanarayanai]|uniref:hypothetical protein n=1 Tax=Georgenia satyanarayanai TaxID=860221 RepID=UPI00203C3462|nr:hypothetical protein [Georgenia satyanarayanai]MCM3662495.1 hypothetical protein [Georgenia satyanarayanai]